MYNKCTIIILRRQIKGNIMNKQEFLKEWNKPVKKTTGGILEDICSILLTLGFMLIIAVVVF